MMADGQLSGRARRPDDGKEQAMSDRIDPGTRGGAVQSIDGGVLGPVPVTRAPASRLGSLDPAAIPFGSIFTDHMFMLTYADGAWREPTVVPYGPLSLEPGVMTFHYGQSLFEGLKAYRDPDGAIRLFRPELNARRMHDSCAFLAIPPLPDGAFEAALAAYLRVDAAWVPAKPDQALYLPLVFSTEPHLDVRPSKRFVFVVIGSPVGSYFVPGAKGLALIVEETLARVAPGSGMGAAKASANYTLSLRASRLAHERGFDQVIWLDGAEHRWVEEAGLMNLFAVIDGVVATPPLNGNILPGITRDSILALLRHWGEPVEERPIAIDALVDGIAAGRVSEVFAAGTAAVVTPVRRIGRGGRDYVLPAAPEPSVAARLRSTLTDIQYGRGDDAFGWSRVVVPAGA
jgi:branched-chain amino acid aminotransferase